MISLRQLRQLCRLGVAVLPGALALGLFESCASAPPPVEIAGAEQELRSLVGDWSGTYAYLGHGRSGSIRLKLMVDPKSDATIAFGDVLMVPDDLTEARRSPGAPANGSPQERLATAQALQIRFVSVAAGLVSGTMEPYRDPESGNVLSTTFTGKVKDGRIEGTFLAFGGTANAPQRGIWHVERRALVAPK